MRPLEALTSFRKKNYISFVFFTIFFSFLFFFFHREYVPVFILLLYILREP